MTREAQRRVHRLDHHTLSEIVCNFLEVCDPHRPCPSCRPGCWAQDPDAVLYGMPGAEWAGSD